MSTESVDTCGEHHELQQELSDATDEQSLLAPDQDSSAGLDVQQREDCEIETCAPGIGYCTLFKFFWPLALTQVMQGSSRCDIVYRTPHCSHTSFIAQTHGESICGAHER